jgi:hypothetical protein
VVKEQWLHESMQLAEDMRQILPESGMLSGSSQTRRAEVEKLLASLRGLRSALAKGGYEEGRVEQFVQQTLVRLGQVDMRNKTLQGQLLNLERTSKGGGKGTEKPACWASPDTGKPEYIFDIALTSTGVRIRDNALPHRKEEQQQLPLQTMVFDVELSPEHFKVAALTLYEWSVTNNCRFFVQVFDLTQAHEKDIYKRHLRTVGERFYYYEALNARF